MKKQWIALAMLALFVGMTGRVWAATSDALTVTITPVGDYALDIDTTGVTLDFPSANLNSDYNVVLPATVTIQSTLASTEMQLDPTITGGWTLNSDAAADHLQMWALFTETSVTSIPAVAGDDFDNTNDRVLAGADVADGATGKWENATLDLDAATNQEPNDKYHMWVRFHTPSATGNNDQKAVKLTLTAEAPN